MADLTGSVDDRRRPLLRMPVPGHDDLLAIIDTAFTGQLLVDEQIAGTWGVVVIDIKADVELGDGSRHVVKQGLLSVSCFDTMRDVTVLVVAHDPSRRARLDGEPVALVGTELLFPDILTVNFSSGLVTIQQSL